MSPSTLKTTTQKIVLASGNKGKLKEINHRLSHLSYTLISQNSLGIHCAEETGTTFVENALIKARHASKESGLPALADDSGLAVDLLNGAPGIYSARYAGEGATDADNNARLLEQLSPYKETQCSAHFYCVIVYLRHALDPAPIICQAAWHGQIVKEAKGENGFGYDPLFFIPELGVTSAQLSPDEKNQISHRGQALSLFIKQLEALTHDE